MRVAVLLPATLLLLLLVPLPGAASPVVVRQNLQRGEDDADARGTAVFKVRGRGSRRTGTLVVTGRRLERRSSYEVTIDGVRVGALETSRRGSGKARFRTAPRRNDQFLGVDPRGRSVALVRTGGGTALAGSLPVKGLDPGDVRCCLPDDSGTECEDRTPAECAAQGGVDLGPGSCLPDPCGGATSPGSDIRCCLPDDSGPECEDRTAAECAAQGGVNIGAGSCLPNPCGATSTPPAVVMPSVVVTCERRADRSRVSVNGKGLASGSYRARGDVRRRIGLGRGQRHGRRRGGVRLRQRTRRHRRRRDGDSRGVPAGRAAAGHGGDRNHGGRRGRASDRDLRDALRRWRSRGVLATIAAATGRVGRDCTNSRHR